MTDLIGFMKNAVENEEEFGEQDVSDFMEDVTEEVGDLYENDQLHDLVIIARKTNGDIDVWSLTDNDDPNTHNDILIAILDRTKHKIMLEDLMEETEV